MLPIAYGRLMVPLRGQILFDNDADAPKPEPGKSGKKAGKREAKKASKKTSRK